MGGGKGRGGAGKKGGKGPPADANGQALLQVLHGKGDGKGKGKLPAQTDTPEDKGKYLLDIVLGNVSAPAEKGKGKGKSKGGYAQDGGINALILGVCQDDSHCLDPTDFDYRAKRFLSELNTRSGEEKVKEALANCVEVAMTKERDDVDNWRGYVYKLLRREDPELYDELKNRDLAKRRGGPTGEEG
jgi:hypothetical protein